MCGGINKGDKKIGGSCMYILLRGLVVEVETASLITCIRES